MSFITSIRRILVDNMNVIEVINNHTDPTEKIGLAKIDLTGLNSAVTVGISGALALSIPNVGASGVILTFTTAFGTVYSPDGDYCAFATGKSGGANVNVVLTQTPTTITIKPDYDGTTVKLSIIPITPTLGVLSSSI